MEKNTITVDEGVKAKASAADDAVRGTLFGLMSGAPDATAIVMSASAGTLKDPILQDVFSKMDAGDKIKVINDMFNLGNKMDTERREQEEAGEVEAEAGNKKNFLSIINVDTDDEAAMAAAKELHKGLLKDQYYTNAERNAAEARLGLSAKPAGTETKTTKEALKQLNIADFENRLTFELVESLKDSLSMAEYSSALKRIDKERKDGIVDAKNIIGTKLRYNEFKDANNALGQAADRYFSRSMNELYNWLGRPKEPIAGGLPGGAKANYQDIATKAREIISVNDAEYKQDMREAMNSFLSNTSGLTMIGMPTDVEGAKEYLRNRLAANPRDGAAEGVGKIIRDFEKILRD